MPTQIIDDTSCIRLIVDGQVCLINKNWIRSIQTVQDNVVMLDIAAGSLHNLYIRLDDVSVPDKLDDVNALRDAIKGMLDTSAATAIPNTVTASVKLMQNILTANAASQIVSSPAIIDQTVPNVTYYGYTIGNGDTKLATWAIMRTIRNNNIITNTWANGVITYVNVWDDRYTFKYAPLNATGN